MTWIGALLLKQALLVAKRNNCPNVQVVGTVHRLGPVVPSRGAPLRSWWWIEFKLLVDWFDVRLDSSASIAPVG